MTQTQPPAEQPQSLSARQLIAADLPQRQRMLDPVLDKKSLAMLYGPRGLGKTFVALGIAWAVASGKDFLKWRATRPHRVLYIDGEMAAIDMRDRLRLFGPPPEKLSFLMADLNRHFLPDLADIAGQRALVRNWGEMPDLVVLDNLSSLVGFRRNDPDSWNNVQRWFLLMRQNDIAVLVVHHANKEGAQRGTARREDVLDVVLSMRRPAGYQPQDGARFELHFDKARGLVGDTVEPIEVRLASQAGRVRWDWGPVQAGDLNRVVALLKDGLNPLQVAKELGIAKSKSYLLRERAVAMGLLTPETEVRPQSAKASPA